MVTLYFLEKQMVGFSPEKPSTAKKLLMVSLKIFLSVISPTKKAAALNLFS